MFLLQCPKCKQKMKYQSRNQDVAKKVKRCVYCGHSFKVRQNVVKIL